MVQGPWIAGEAEGTYKREISISPDAKGHERRFTKPFPPNEGTHECYAEN
jgi:hypothetical protein